MVATPSGTRVYVTMSISLPSAIFVVFAFWKLITFMTANNPRIVADSSGFFVCLGFMLVLLAMVAWGFFPEATKAQELLTRIVFNPTVAELEQQTTFHGY
jgi:hypothetical protein